MDLYEIGVSTKVYANLYVRASSGKEAWDKAEAYLLTEEDTEDCFLDEDRFYEDGWSLDSINRIGEE